MAARLRWLWLCVCLLPARVRVCGCPHVRSSVSLPACLPARGCPPGALGGPTWQNRQSAERVRGRASRGEEERAQVRGGSDGGSRRKSSSSKRLSLTQVSHPA